MNINLKPLFDVAERHLREHLKANPKDDDGSAMLAISGPLAEEIGRENAWWTLHHPAMHTRLLILRKTLALEIPL
jgi:hypothetical protein